MVLISSSTSRLCDARVEVFRSEFGPILADRIIESEEVDFLWEARVSERYLGQQVLQAWDAGNSNQELSRVAVLSCLTGQWSVGVCLVDGDGIPVELVWKRRFEAEAVAQEAFRRVN